MRRSRELLVLDIVASDNTFARIQARGEELWVGKCIHCNARLTVTLDGALLAPATIEHITPRSRGGTDALENLALACARCNHEKGVRHDARRRGRTRADEVTALLAARRRQRWRAPAISPK